MIEETEGSSAGTLSAVTKNLRFTTNAFVLPMRNPFLAAKQVATAAAIVVGVVMPDDARATRLPSPAPARPGKRA